MDKFLIRTKRKADDSTSQDSTVKEGKKEEALESSSATAVPPFQSISDALRVPSETLTDATQFEAHFSRVATFLLNHVLLIANRKSFRICEIEFYFTSEKHSDPFTHRSQVQSQAARWYFHKTGGRYRTGTYKGLDISIGNGAEEQGGILIRSVEAVGFNPKFVCGPCLSVDHLLEVCGAASIDSLVKDQMKGDLNVEKEDGPLKLVMDKEGTLAPKVVLSTPRVGLHMNKPGNAEPQKQYVYKFYRFLVEPKKVFKGKMHMIVALHHMGKSKADIRALVNSDPTKYIGLFEEGKGKKAEDFTKQKLTDDNICRAMGCLAAAGYL